MSITSLARWLSIIYGVAVDNLTPDEASLLQKLREAKAAQDRIPPFERKPISHPEKYANPIGMVADGCLFLEPGSAQGDQ